MSNATRSGDQEGTQRRDRGEYTKLSSEEKAKIAKRAAEHGVAATIRYYAKRGFPHLKESSVRTWRNAYNRQIRIRLNEGSDMTVEKLPEKKKGRPYLLGEELDTG